MQQDITLGMLFKKGLRWALDQEDNKKALAQKRWKTEEPKKEKWRINLKRGSLTPCVHCHSRRLLIVEGEGYLGRLYILRVKCKHCRQEGCIAVNQQTRLAIQERTGNRIEWDNIEIVPRR